MLATARPSCFRLASAHKARLLFVINRLVKQSVSGNDTDVQTFHTLLVLGSRSNYRNSGIMRNNLLFTTELRCAAFVQLSSSVSFLVSQQMSPAQVAASTNICWVRAPPLSLIHYISGSVSCLEMKKNSRPYFLRHYYRNTLVIDVVCVFAVYVAALRERNAKCEMQIACN